MIFIVLSLLTQSVFASVSSSCSDTSLGKTLVTLEERSKEPQHPLAQDWIQPILEEAKTFSTQSTRLTLPELTSNFQFNIRKELRRLLKHGCISRITALAERKVVRSLQFVSRDDVELEQSIRTLPNPATYLFNLYQYSLTANAEWHQAVQQLDRVFPKRKSPIGQLSTSEFLFLYYTRTEINLLSNLFMDTLTLMTAEATRTMRVFSPITQREVELAFSPTDLAHLSIRYLDREVGKMNLSSFAAKPINNASVLMAALATKDVDANSVNVLLRNKSIVKPKEAFLKRVGRITWGVTKVVLYQIPVTLPFIMVGTIVYDAIQSKKKLERSQADAAHLIPAP